MSRCNMSESANICILEGIISVEAAVRSGSREVKLCYVDESKVRKRDRRVLSFLKLLNSKNIPVNLCDRNIIDSFLNENDPDCGNSHGGIAAVCGERRFSSIERVLSRTSERGGFAVVLDGVEDPFNFGYSVRNLYAAGAGGVIIPQRSWMSSAGVCARASAGATELCDIAVMPDMSSSSCGERSEFIKMIKKTGFYTVCAAKTADCEDIFEFEPEFPLVLFIGGEKRGISPEFVENADSIVCIPYFSDARFSLPTASTAAVFGFELAKKLNY